MDIYLSFQHLLFVFNFIVLMSLVVISPGPDFVLVVRNSILYSRRDAFISGLGISVGGVINISYLLFILQAINSHLNPLYLMAFQAVSGVYLAYLGLSYLVVNTQYSLSSRANFEAVCWRKTFKLGLITELMNPKSIALYASILASSLRHGGGHSYFLWFDISTFSLFALWFSFVSVCFGSQYVQRKFLGLERWIDIVLGVILLMVSIGLLHAALGSLL